MAGTYQNHFRRTIPGDIDSVRQRLCDVLESFGYVVLGDAPIQAKRQRQKSIWVAMVLDYETSLTVALKPISPASTLATFEYDLEQLFTKGEMQALEREAEAIIAMATSASVEIFCPSQRSCIRLDPSRAGRAPRCLFLDPGNAPFASIA